MQPFITSLSFYSISVLQQFLVQHEDNNHVIFTYEEKEVAYFLVYSC